MRTNVALYQKVFNGVGMVWTRKNYIDPGYAMKDFDKWTTERVLWNVSGGHPIKWTARAIIDHSQV